MKKKERERERETDSWKVDLQVDKLMDTQIDR